jgi:hypothetical protein
MALKPVELEAHILFCGGLCYGIVSYHANYTLLCGMLGFSVNIGYLDILLELTGSCFGELHKNVSQ